MPDDPAANAPLDSEEVNIEFLEEGVTTTSVVTPISQGRYRLDVVPVMVESVGFRDVIEAQRVSSGTLRFIRVIQRSDWKIYDFILSESTIESPAFRSILDRIAEHGGHWERIFGGCIYLCLPPHVEWDPTPEIMN